jgi:hypothetical protein
VEQVDRDRLIELGVLRERQRIEKLLPEIIRIGNINCLWDIDKEMPRIRVKIKGLESALMANATMAKIMDTESRL